MLIAEERHAAPPVLANGAQHRAVASDDHDQLGVFMAVRRQSISHCASLGVALVGNHQVALLGEAGISSVEAKPPPGRADDGGCKRRPRGPPIRRSAGDERPGCEWSGSTRRARLQRRDGGAEGPPRSSGCPERFRIAKFASFQRSVPRVHSR